MNSIRPRLEAHHKAFQGPNFQERGGRALAAAAEQAQAPRPTAPRQSQACAGKIPPWSTPRAGPHPHRDSVHTDRDSSAGKG